MPFFTLANAQKRDPNSQRVLDKEWSNRDVIGSQSLSLVLLGANWQPNWTTALQSAFPTLSPQERDAQTWAFIASKSRFSSLVPLLGFGATPELGSNVSLLLDEEKKISSIFGLSLTTSSLVQIDRAGFLRRVQPLYNASDLLKAVQSSAPPTPTLALDQPAPDFLMRDMNGRMRSPREFRGRKNLLLTFFPHCFTGGCVVHLSSLRDEYSKLQAVNVKVLAVSIDEAEGERGQKAFAQKLKLPFDLLPDPGRNLSILYGAAVSPEQVPARISILIDKNGVVRWIDKQIDLKTHGRDVLEKIEALKLDP